VDTILSPGISSIAISPDAALRVVTGKRKGGQAKVIFMAERYKGEEKLEKKGETRARVGFGIGTNDSAEKLI